MTKLESICSCCGQLSISKKEQPKPWLFFCPYCMHAMVRMPDGTTAELHRDELAMPENRDVIDRGKAEQQRLCHEKGMWG